MILLVGFYEDADRNRQEELLECIQRNVANEWIDELHLLVEYPVTAEGVLSQYPSLRHQKIRLVPHGQRVTYRDLFGYANKHLYDQRVIVANADIYFDHTLARLDGYDLSARLLCLSRWNVEPDGSTHFFDHPSSQDAWIFQTPLRDFACDFHLGVLGCDNRLAWEAQQTGLLLSNPGRSVHALHLHLSQVRRYSPQHELIGATASISADFLGTPWLWFIVPCMNQLADLRRTVRSVLAQPNSSYVLVDYSSSDGTAEWAREAYPRVHVMAIKGRRRFRTEAHNRGASAVDADGSICFLGPDVILGNGFSGYALRHVAEGAFLVPDRTGLGFDSVLVCRKSDFDRVGGFNVACSDLRRTMRSVGLEERTFPASLIEPTWAVPANGNLFHDSADIDKGRLARITFHERMGYVVAPLEPGVSSHTNLSRPFTEIPEPLQGLPFTQVVAYCVTPVEVEFVSSGTLYVLVGDDWDGYYTATAWLRGVATRADLPKVQTTDGIGFEVWSLEGESGERFVFPTQVMLVAEHLIRRTPRLAVQSRTREEIFALTSLSPSQQRARHTRDCIASWRSAGLEVRAFNHPDEVSTLATRYDVEFVPITDTAAQVFGRHLVPINCMLRWAAERNAPVLVINADIELQLQDWEVKRLRWLSDEGLCYFVRFNQNALGDGAQREPNGIDAFLFHGRYAANFPDSFLSMGEPFWDYWLPCTFAAKNRPTYAVEFPAAFHRSHQNQWSWPHWQLCALEFARVTRELVGDGSFDDCQSMSFRVRQSIERNRQLISRRPPQIESWVSERFGQPGPKTFLELGAHQGTDTSWMASLPDVVIHAFEPDPRNTPPAHPNVILNRAAVADADGRGSLILSKAGWGQVWTYSSSIKRPKNHFNRFPVTFGGSVDVQLVKLDTYCEHQGLDAIDFVWADIQGAEGEMIRGGMRALARTHYLYTEYSDDELYEGQATLNEILDLLPSFRVIELWPDDVLLENVDFHP